MSVTVEGQNNDTHYVCGLCDVHGRGDRWRCDSCNDDYCMSCLKPDAPLNGKTERLTDRENALVEIYSDGTSLVICELTVTYFFS